MAYFFKMNSKSRKFGIELWNGENRHAIKKKKERNHLDKIIKQRRLNLKQMHHTETCTTARVYRYNK